VVVTRQGAGKPHVAAEQTALQPEDLVLDPRGAGQHVLAGDGQRIPARRPVEQTHPEPGLERVEAAEHGRVIDAERPGGALQAAVPGDREEAAQIVPVATLLHDRKLRLR
jgi:hypothetical protein